MKVVSIVLMAAAGVLGLNFNSEAANLSGPGTLNLNGAVKIKQTVLSDNGTPLNLVDDISKTEFNFLPDVVGGSAVTIPFSGGSGGFVSFNGTNPVDLFTNTKSLIVDTTVDGSLSPDYLAAPIANFLVLKDELGNVSGTTFTLERVDLPTYETSSTGGQALTTAKLNVYGTWFDAVSGLSYKGEGVFSSTFVAPSETVVLQRLRSGSGVITAFAATIDAEPIEIPESKMVLGLFGLGLAGVVSAVKKAKV